MKALRAKKNDDKQNAGNSKKFPSPRHRIHFALGAVQALELYLTRGREALNLLMKNQVDQAVLKLNERDIAYQQFLSLDHLAKEAGQDITQDQSVIDIWTKIKAVNDELYKILQTHTDISKKDLDQNSTELKKIKTALRKNHLRIVKS